MKVVLDTNILTVIISKRSRYYPIWQSLRNGSFELLVTSDILLEYHEILSDDLSPELAENVLGGLELLPNLTLVTKYYYWDLIKQDPDDNKFVDCAIAGGADFIVTNDTHFKVLKNIPFPYVAVLSADEFLEMTLNQ
ncbi:MAG: putative toxin-antitoxin system toxin component, PIN family [Saprospiraceae bacterium]